MVPNKNGFDHPRRYTHVGPAGDMACFPLHRCLDPGTLGSL